MDDTRNHTNKTGKQAIHSLMRTTSHSLHTTATHSTITHSTTTTMPYYYQNRPVVQTWQIIVAVIAPFAVLVFCLALYQCSRLRNNHRSIEMDNRTLTPEIEMSIYSRNHNSWNVRQSKDTTNWNITPDEIRKPATALSKYYYTM